MKWCGGCLKIIALAVLLEAAVSGCDKAAPPPAAKHVFPTHAQPRLSTLRFWLGPEEITAELALNAEEQETGMMFRTNMDENSGMMFPLPAVERADFWMKNCPMSLSAAYIDPSGAIAEIRELHAEDTNGVVAKSDNIYYVLEMNEGWFQRHHIEPGTFVRSEKGSLQQTFIRH
ncbi:MAG TPA: DUF192 domain-containing protein [Verrucomicrobiae bacterium]